MRKILLITIIFGFAIFVVRAGAPYHNFMFDTTLNVTLIHSKGAGVIFTCDSAQNYSVPGVCSVHQWNSPVTLSHEIASFYWNNTTPIFVSGSSNQIFYITCQDITATNCTGKILRSQIPARRSGLTSHLQMTVTGSLLPVFFYLDELNQSPFQVLSFTAFCDDVFCGNITEKLIMMNSNDPGNAGLRTGSKAGRAGGSIYRNFIDDDRVTGTMWATQPGLGHDDKAAFFNCPLEGRGFCSSGILSGNQYQVIQPRSTTEQGQVPAIVFIDSSGTQIMRCFDATCQTSSCPVFLDKETTSLRASDVQVAMEPNGRVWVLRWFCAEGLCKAFLYFCQSDTCEIFQQHVLIAAGDDASTQFLTLTATPFGEVLITRDSTLQQLDVFRCRFEQSIICELQAVSYQNRSFVEILIEASDSIFQDASLPENLPENVPAVGTKCGVSVIDIIIIVSVVGGAVIIAAIASIIACVLIRRRREKNSH